MIELKQPYKGRGIIIGQLSNKHPFSAYFVTGRSEASRSRTLDLDESCFRIFTSPTDTVKLSQGNIDLLIYDAMIGFTRYLPDGETVHYLAVSNGKQTNAALTGVLAGKSLDVVNSQYSYEPDAPNFTPRISGTILFKNYQCPTIDLSLIKKSAYSPQISISNWNFGAVAGQALELTTYTGQNVPTGQPLPSFNSDPTVIPIDSLNLNQLTEELIPRIGHPDFSVGLAVALYNQKTGFFDISIQNKAGANKHGSRN